MTSTLIPTQAFQTKFTFGEPRLHTDGDVLAISFGKEGWLYSVEELGILRKWNPDSGQQLSAAVILLTGGSKLAQAGAYDRAYEWLDQSLQLVAPRAPADTTGPRQHIVPERDERRQPPAPRFLQPGSAADGDELILMLGEVGEGLRQGCVSGRCLLARALP